MDLKKRFESIDFMRAVGVLLMVQIHLGMYLLVLGDKQTATYNVMNTIAQSAAPLFLTAVGISLAISASRRKKDATDHVVKRGLFLIAVGLLFINVWNADILHYIGLYIILAFFLLKLSKFWRIVAANIFLWGAPVVLLFVNYMSGWEILA